MVTDSRFKQQQQTSFFRNILVRPPGSNVAVFCCNCSSHPTGGVSSYLYFVLALLAMTPLVWLTPPFQVPDEPQHFFRAYELSEFEFLGVVEAGAAGAVLPSSLADLTVHFLGTTSIHSERKVNNVLLRNTLTQLSNTLEPEHREFLAFTGAAFYSPLPYIPQALAIAAGRAAGFSPLGLLYVSRLTNGLVAILLMTVAIRLMPVGRMVMLVLGLLPMTLYEFASASPDAAVISTAFLFTAIATRSLFHRRWNGKTVTFACLLGVVFCSLKPVYSPLMLTGLSAALRRGSTKHILLVHLLIVIIVLGVTVFWLHYASSSLLLPKAGTSLSQQLNNVFENPGHFIISVAVTILWRANFLFESYIGYMGWLTIKLPLIMYIMPVGSVVACMFLSSSNEYYDINIIDFAWLCTLLISCSLLVFFALYLYWTPVGNNTVEGVQGRYFLPLSCIFSAILAKLTRLSHKHNQILECIIVLLSAVEAILTPFVIVHNYGVF